MIDAIKLETKALASALPTDTELRDVLRGFEDRPSDKAQINAFSDILAERGWWNLAEAIAATTTYSKPYTVCRWPHSLDKDYYFAIPDTGFLYYLWITEYRSEDFRVWVEFRNKCPYENYEVFSDGTCHEFDTNPDTDYGG